MKRTILVSIIFLLIAGGAAIAENKKGEPEYLIKMATIAPEMGEGSELMYKMNEELMKRTQGRLKLRVYFGGVMGDEPDIVKKMRLGQLQGGMVLTLLGLGHICPAAKVLELPFLFNNHDEIDHVVFTEMRPTFARLFEEKGAYLVCWSEIGFGYYFFKNRVNSFKDIKKVKMVSFTGDPVFAAAEKAAGFENLIPLHISETLTGLQTGLIDGTLGPFLSVIAFQWFSYTNYVLNLPFSYSPAGTVVDKKFFDRLPRELREVFFDVWRKWEPEWIQIARRMEKDSYGALLQRGMVEIEKEKALAIAEEMKKGTHPLYDKFIDEYYPSWLLAEILERLAKYRAEKSEGKSR
ncbi:MAG: TRAP transporter substrate-binding protein DctP [Deltaproteobacteria bacterium]|nr:MAG: TRAP transporter substrate-binding protein DctP [Deltaproteobacteria bacterium]